MNFFKRLFCKHKWKCIGVSLLQGGPIKSKNFKCEKCDAKKREFFIPDNMYGFHPLHWKKMKQKYQQDTGKKIHENDPEFDAQKIYNHWLKSYK